MLCSVAPSRPRGLKVELVLELLDELELAKRNNRGKRLPEAR